MLPHGAACCIWESRLFHCPRDPVRLAPNAGKGAVPVRPPGRADGAAGSSGGGAAQSANGPPFDLPTHLQVCASERAVTPHPIHHRFMFARYENRTHPRFMTTRVPAFCSPPRGPNGVRPASDTNNALGWEVSVAGPASRAGPACTLPKLFRRVASPPALSSAAGRVHVPKAPRMLSRVRGPAPHAGLGCHPAARRG
jgi:hypothetical protein